MPGTAWLDLLRNRILERYDRSKSLWGEHLARYASWYSNRARRTRDGADDE